MRYDVFQQIPPKELWTDPMTGKVEYRANFNEVGTVDAGNGAEAIKAAYLLPVFCVARRNKLFHFPVVQRVDC